MDIDRAVRAELVELFEQGGPGAAVLVAVGGVPVAREAFGMADVELEVPMRPEFIFRLGSITKQFTAVGILLLMERGDLRLDDPITRFLPDYPDYGREVTLQHLLTHNSGVPSYTSMPAFADVLNRHVSTADVIDFFKDEPPEFPPGTQHEYSNSGYFLLGAIIEHVSGLSYGDFMTRQIFEQLKMTQSEYGHTRPLISGRVSGYGWSENEWRNAAPLSMTWPGAAGGLISCIDDLLRWDNALYTEELLSQESLRRAWTPATLKNGDPVGYGFGWAISRRDDLVSIEHGGGINGFASYAMRIPDRHLFIAVLMNGIGGIESSDVADRIYAHVLSAT